MRITIADNIFSAIKKIEYQISKTGICKIYLIEKTYLLELELW